MLESLREGRSRFVTRLAQQQQKIKGRDLTPRFLNDMTPALHNCQLSTVNRQLSTQRL
ncbi:MAG: hypothetical protein HC849_22535, partial [Oscillatoriales cyanobacterium RU_3_3]|nr:hypothetical protein [Oscillatoriales cyanobacterium RU_3_3]